MTERIISLGAYLRPFRTRKLGKPAVGRYRDYAETRRTWAIERPATSGLLRFGLRRLSA
jgi:hypothetical protein